MERITQRAPDGGITLAGDLKSALGKLAQYEDLHAALVAQAQDIHCRMARLQADGKSKTATYHHLLANKLTLASILERFSLYLRE